MAPKLDFKSSYFEVGLFQLLFTKFAIMYRKDQLKGIIAIVLFGIIGICFFVFGEDSPILKGVALGGVVAWLVSMVILNRKFKDRE